MKLIMLVCRLGNASEKYITASLSASVNFMSGISEMPSNKGEEREAQSDSRTKGVI